MKINKFIFLFCFSIFLGFQIKAQCPVANSCSPNIAINAGTGFNGGIYNVVLGNISNASSGDIGGYQDFSCFDSTSLVIGSTNTITIQNGSTVSEDVKVWVDLDNNGTYDVNNELIFVSLNKKIHTGNFILPSGTFQNIPLRMRISSDNAGSTFTDPITPCSTPQFGQVEDYTVYARPNNSKPTTDFTSDLQQTTCDGSIQFTDLSTDLPNSWKWFFGDGDSSFLPNPIHNYIKSGTFDVQLITSNSFGFDTLTKNNFISFDTNITAPISCSPTTLSHCCGFGILNFSLGTINQSSGDGSEGYVDFSCLGSASFIENESYAFSISTGVSKQDFHIYLDLNNDGLFNESNELIKTIIGKTSFSGFIIFPSEALKGIPLRLRVSTDSEGQSIQACSDVLNGQIEDYSVIITASPKLPIADFTVDNQEKCDSLFQFTNTSLNVIDSVLWDFGDGSFSSEDNPLHSFSSFGKFTITLISYNGVGSDTLTKVNYILRNTEPKRLCNILSKSLNFDDIGIKKFIFANIQNTTTGNNNEYKNYSCDFLAEVETGKTYPVSVFTGNDKQEEVKIFIDWNNDGTIGPDETVFKKSDFVTHSGTITIPLKENVVTNTRLRMRVISGIVSGGENGVSSPCDSIIGEVEDYSIIVTILEGINQSNTFNYKLYPNPTNGIFTISSNDNEMINGLKIYNTIGKLVFSKSNILKNTISLNLNLKNGLYFAEINSNEGTSIQKLIIK